MNGIRKSYVVIHLTVISRQSLNKERETYECWSSNHCSYIVGPLEGTLWFIATLLWKSNIIINLKILGYEFNLNQPIVRLVCPLGICIILVISSESCGKLKKTTVRNGIFHHPSVIERIELPPQPPVTVCVVPAVSLSIENCLCEWEPRRLLWTGIREFHFCRWHGCKSPEHGIFIFLEEVNWYKQTVTENVKSYFCSCLVLGFRVILWSHLE